jgi:hypothetical protein
MDERLKFIARLLDGEKMAVLCRQFGISRKTGYKILTRYNEIGLEGLTDRSRRPYRHANRLPVQIETRIVRLKQDKSSWGAPWKPAQDAPDGLRWGHFAWVHRGRASGAGDPVRSPIASRQNARRRRHRPLP